MFGRKTSPTAASAGCVGQTRTLSNVGAMVIARMIARRARNANGERDIWDPSSAIRQGQLTAHARSRTWGRMRDGCGFAHAQRGCVRTRGRSVATHLLLHRGRVADLEFAPTHFY